MTWCHCFLRAACLPFQHICFPFPGLYIHPKGWICRTGFPLSHSHIPIRDRNMGMGSPRFTFPVILPRLVIVDHPLSLCSRGKKLFHQNNWHHCYKKGVGWSELLIPTTFSSFAWELVLITGSGPLITYEYRIKKAIIKANKPVASDSANPRIAYWNNCLYYLYLSIKFRLYHLTLLVPIFPFPLPGSLLGLVSRVVVEEYLILSIFSRWTGPTG